MTTSSSAAANSPLLTDLYQLTMLQSYLAQDMRDTSVFELFVRRLPRNRNFLVFAGLHQVMEYLQSLHFSADDLEWLLQSGLFTPEFVEGLRDFRFTGDVHAMAEGTLFFPHEPVLRITAPLPQAQLIESRLINIINYQSMVASKAARCRLAAGDKVLLDFGMRRAHGAEAAMFAARASYIGGFDGTATVLAGREYGIPLSGTMAHAYIQAHDSESQAFLNFARSHPDNVVLLIDTYDTAQGAANVVRVAETLKDEGISVKAVRIDSGSIADLSVSVRRILDEGGCHETKIFASGDFDEYRIEALAESAAPVDGFGVGTRMVVSQDAPSLDSVYKLQEYAGQARRKFSEGKETWPGRKQVYRCFDSANYCEADLVTLEDDKQEKGTPLLSAVMRNGESTLTVLSIGEIKAHCKMQLLSLPKSLRPLKKSPEPYNVQRSPSIDKLAQNRGQFT